MNCKECYWINRLQNPQSGYIGLCACFHSMETCNTLKADKDVCVHFTNKEDYERSIFGRDTKIGQGKRRVFPEEDPRDNETS